jgi:hypothetical protein
MFVLTACTSTSNTDCRDLPQVVVHVPTLSFNEQQEEPLEVFFAAFAEVIHSGSDLVSATISCQDCLAGETLDLPGDGSVGLSNYIHSGQVHLFGAASASTYASALQTILFHSTREIHSLRTVTINAQVATLDYNNEMVHNSGTDVVVQLRPVRDAAVMSPGSSSGVHIQGQSTPVLASVSLSDADNTTLLSAQVTCVTCQPGDQLVVSSTVPNLVSTTLTDEPDEPLQLTFTGESALGVYESLLSSVRFQTTSNRSVSRDFTASVSGRHLVSNEVSSVLFVHAAAGHYDDDGILTPCAAGSWTDATGASACIPCDAGSYGSETGAVALSTCTMCPDGQWQNMPGQSLCVNCTAGQYGVVGSDQSSADYCDECAAGTAQALSSQTGCVACPLGQYSTGGNESCTPWSCCAAGEHKVLHSNTSNGQCVGCPSGSFMTQDDVEACEDRGEDQAHLVLAACHACPVGTYGDPAMKDFRQTMSGYCVECAAGTSNPHNGSVGIASCTACEPGTYAADDGQELCTACEVGQYQTDHEQESCTPCGHGTYVDPHNSANQTTASYCVHCSNGNFYSADSTNSDIPCEPCAVGKYGSLEVETSSAGHCIDCAPGTYQMEPGVHTSCDPCGDGLYQDQPGSHECLPCDSTPCADGQYESMPCVPTQNRVCRALPTIVGLGSSGQVHFVEQAAAVHVAPVADVELHSEGTLHSIVVEHPASLPSDQFTFGAFADSVDCAEHACTITLLPGATTQDFSAVLQALQFSNAGDLTYGENHTPGQNRTVSVSMRACVNPDHGAVQCGPASQVLVVVVPENDLPIVDVDVLTNEYVQGSDDMLVNTSGLDIVDLDHTTLQQAVVSLSDYQHGDVLGVRSIAVEHVPYRAHPHWADADPQTLPGTSGWTFSGDVQASAMDEWCEHSCNPNESTPGCDAHCVPQLAFALSPGSLTISGAASLHTYEMVLRNLTYRSDAGLSDGMVLGADDRHISIVVHDGHGSSDSVDLSHITICAARGFFANNVTGNVEACAVGAYADNICAFSCKACPEGTFGADTDNQASADYCTACAVGNYQPDVGQTECIACPQGHYGAEHRTQENATHCQACVAGQHQSTTGQAECTSCAEGHYASAAGSHDCTACHPGQYQDEVQQQNCTECPIGTASSGVGMTTSDTCVECMDAFTNMTGQAECSPWSCCDKGYVNVGASATAAGSCEACAEGTYRDAKSCSAEPCQTWDTVCDVGYGVVGANFTSAGKCELCDAGRYNNAAHSNSTCQLCALGKYSADDDEGKTECIDCVAGSYADTAGQAECVACAENKFADSAVSQSSPEHCQDCPVSQWAPWGSCSATCGTGTQSRTRALLQPENPDVTACATEQVQECNTAECPHDDHCVYLKCRYVSNDADEFSIQVYHHHREPASVHHCKLYEGQDGETECHCFCWYHGDTMESLQAAEELAQNVDTTPDMYAHLLAQSDEPAGALAQ